MEVLSRVSPSGKNKFQNKGNVRRFGKTNNLTKLIPLEDVLTRMITILCKDNKFYKKNRVSSKFKIRDNFIKSENNLFNPRNI